MEEKIIIINIIFYILNLIFINYLFKNRYIFPFRSNDIINFCINTIIFSYLSYSNGGLFFLIYSINLNICLFYIFFHLLNMINTSSRTKIILDIYKLKKIKILHYKNIYNEKIIFDKRFKRFKSSNQISTKNLKIKFNSEGISISKFINLILNKLKKT